ncbi:MAG: ATP-dependent DNA helicase [Oscillatoriales cyanobacterium]|nr:MAG: ATP-dependent DNA helicase [Oscillatoriales cyanobacterium]
MIEVEVHTALRDFLRAHPDYQWPHYLTMARLVARAMRLGRSASIQAGTFSSCAPEVSLGYLMPLLLWPQAAILVADDALRSRLLRVEIPQLLAWTQRDTKIIEGDRWPGDGFNGLLLVSPAVWLADRLGDRQRFPPEIPTIIDDLDRLTDTARRLLTLELHDRDWSEGLDPSGDQARAIRSLRAELVRSLFHHPPNPYNAYLLDVDEQAALREAVALRLQTTPPPRWRTLHHALTDSNCFLWAQLDRDRGSVVLHHSPASIAQPLAAVWSQQPIVAISGAIAPPEPHTDHLRRNLGFVDVTCVQFNPDRQTAGVQLYLPDHLPLPNTPTYKTKLLDELHHLIDKIPPLLALPRPNSPDPCPSQPPPVSPTTTIPIAIIIGDEPLKQSIGALLASEFGSRVKVERADLAASDILVCGWEFWCDRHAHLPTPRVFAISTLPLPPLEHPLVAGRVAHSKQQRQDWFRRYLLPDAMRTLQRAIAPVRSAQGVVALCDTRAIYRSYGKQILRAISPYSELRYLDAQVFTGEG